MILNFRLIEEWLHYAASLNVKPKGFHLGSPYQRHYKLNFKEAVNSN